ARGFAELQLAPHDRRVHLRPDVGKQRRERIADVMAAFQPRDRAADVVLDVEPALACGGELLLRNRDMHPEFLNADGHGRAVDDLTPPPRLKTVKRLAEVGFPSQLAEHGFLSAARTSRASFLRRLR